MPAVGPTSESFGPAARRRHASDSRPAQSVPRGAAGSSEGLGHGTRIRQATGRAQVNTERFQSESPGLGARAEQLGSRPAGPTLGPARFGRGPGLTFFSSDYQP